MRVDRQGNYYAAGDAQTEIEGPLAPDMVFAVVTDVCRKGKWIKKGNPWWDFFAGPWVALIKLRPLMLKLSFIVPKGLR